MEENQQYLSLEEWEEKVLTNVKSFSPSDKDYEWFDAHINLIILKNEFPGYDSPDFFLCEFCADFIDTILSLKPKTAKDAEKINPFLESALKLLAKRIISVKNDDKFIQTAKLIITDPQKPYYKSLSKSNSKPNKFFVNNLNFFENCGVVEAVTEFLKTKKNVKIGKITSLINFFYSIKNECDKESIYKFFEASLQCLQNKLQSIDDKEIRSIDEKDIHQVVEYMKEILIKAPPDVIENLDQTIFVLSIRFAKSPFLKKQFSGLMTIKTQLMSGDHDTKDLCSIVNNEQLIPFLLKDDLHHELVKNFTIILQILLNNGFSSPDDLQQFWNITLRQHASTIESFLKSFEYLLANLSKQILKQIWRIFSQSEIFPIQVLKFFQRIAPYGTDSKRSKLFNALIEYYPKIDENNFDEKKTFVHTLFELVPENPKICGKFQDQCFNQLNEDNDDNVDMSLILSILAASCKCISPEKARDIFNAILNKMINAENELLNQFIELLCLLTSHFIEPFNDDEFNKLLQISFEYLISNTQEIITLYQAIFKVKTQLIVKEKVLLLIHQICEFSLQQQNSTLISFLIFVFEEANNNCFKIYYFNNKQFIHDKHGLILYDDYKVVKSTEKLIGINELWNFAFSQINNDDIIRYLCHLYSSSKKTSDIINYTKICLKHLNNISALKAIHLIMDQVESKFDKLSRNIQENRYLTKSCSYEIRISIEEDEEKTLIIRVPKNISFDAFSERVAFLLGIESKNVIFYLQRKKVLKRNFKLFYGAEFIVETSKKGVFTCEFSNNYFPSLYLSKPKYIKKIFNLIKSNNPEIAGIALDILNLLPTVKEEFEYIYSEIERKPDWNEIFSFDNKSVFLYRLNIVGNLLLNDNEWVDSFYMSGGSLWLLNTLFRDALNDFADDESLQLIIEISILLLNIIKDEKLKKKVVTQLGKDVIEQIIQLSIQHKDSVYFIQTMIEVIHEFALYSPEMFIKSKSFIELFKYSIFSDNSKTRTSITSVIKLLKPKNFLNCILKLLKNAIDKNCDEYFELLNEIVNCNPKKLSKYIMDILFSQYTIKDANLIQQLEFIPPNEQFTRNIFSIFLKVVDIYDILKKEKVFNFITENILFNKLKYFNPSDDIFSIMQNFIKKQPELSKIIVPKIISHNNVKVYSKECDFCFTKYRGIKNLGATCYMNATIQQLFNIPQFRSLILQHHQNIEGVQNEKLNQKDNQHEDQQDNHQQNRSNNLGKKIPQWFVNFQYVFAKLLLFPTKYIDISKFVKNWKWYDEPVNPHEQQDAVEFVQMLLDRLSDFIPEISKIFQGKIKHEIIGTNANFRNECFETFVTFPIEINGHSNIDESFQAFLMPDIFEGNEKYDAEGIGKIEAKRFHYIEEAPPILILHLKRFTFNMKNGKRMKLNDEFFFPKEIDLSKLMKDSSDDSHMYDLIGVEMHSGDASGGHYYSYCRSANNEWNKFNDTVIKSFDQEKLFNLLNTDTNTDNTFRVRKSDNAYLLYYQSRNFHLSQSIHNSSSHSSFNDMEIDINLAQNLAQEIENFVNALILNNKKYLEFMMSIADHSSDVKFVYNFLINSLSIVKEPKQIIEIFQRIKDILNKESSSSFLNEAFIYNDFLLKNENKEVRHICSEVICIAIEKTSIVDPYLSFLENNEKTMINRWSLFDEFLCPLISILESKIKIDKKKWATFLISFLKSLNVSKNKQIKLSINLDSLYKCLSLLVNDEHIREEFEKDFLDPNFLCPLLQSRKNSHNLSIIIRKFLSNEEKENDFYTEIEKFIETEEDMSIVCGIFAISLFFDNQSLLKSVLSFLKGAGYVENEELMIDLVLRIPFIQSELVPFLTNYSHFWIINWLLSVSEKVRECCCELLHKSFSEFPELSFDDIEYIPPSGNLSFLQEISSSLYFSIKKFVEYCVTRVKNSYKLNTIGIDTYKMLPYKEFFGLLKWSVIRSDGISMILKKQKFLIKGMVKFKRVEGKNSELCLETLKFIYSVIGSKYAKDFFCKRRFARKFVKVFSNSTFDSINRVTSVETVSMIVALLPPQYSHFLFDTKFFKNSLQYCFSSMSVTAPQLENYIISNANLKIISPYVWNNDAFNMNYSNSIYFLSLTISLLNSCQKLSNLFFDLGRPKEILEYFAKNHEFGNVASKQIEVLDSFLRAYQQVGKRRDDLLSLMHGQMENIKEMLLLSHNENTRTDVLLAIYRLLMQLFVMSSQFENLVMNFVQNDFLVNIREDVWTGAIELVRFICVNLNSNQKQNKAFNFVKKELLSLKKPYNFKIIVELCDIITKLLMQYEPPVNEIVEFLDKLRNDNEIPEPVPKEICRLIATLRDKDAKGLSRLLKLIS
ncbi:hypothetical protein TRFO_07672 [Tritrichomonas foetus]|uniref:USP domain-containing protein n=1 Tax=Tritrichomonas foetus TaxID=1144522 RepID=A0A1J4JRE3_9EUKA|nr:hypothetical protein TRFO_07672 [Tritrichomonas foetus]|eukprot:OHT01008.1 hypothetical protein TRFO_07672 [Tritrichomonas foetus]